MPPSLDLLIVGAGPYGLAVAAMARARGLQVALLGRPMEFWHQSMPEGMLLRSGKPWHIDPLEQLTYEVYARRQGWPAESLEPITLRRFHQYAAAFMDRYGLRARNSLLSELRREQGHFHALLDDGESLTARQVAICSGFGPFPNLHHPLAGQAGVEHTGRAARLDLYRGQRVIVIGGRQSAFEWAALLAEAGAAEVHVVHRHPTPAFLPSDWSWVDALMERAESQPGWFASLSSQEQAQIVRRFWEEGRLKLEPWLAPRLERREIHFHPEQEVSGREGTTFRLSGGSTLQADRVILATGYKMDLERLTYLGGELLGEIATEQGFPVLDPAFQSSVPGLYFTSFASTRSHGPFFGFIRGCPATARLLARSLS